MSNKKAFISYSWSNPAHELWVLQLAQRLVHDGVDIILDKWHLKEGHDKFAFMESMVHAADIDKVLIILDKKYSEKADGRSGGVGTETTIISSKVYESTTQEKFIPIVVKKDENRNPFLPVYLTSKIYIDLSTEEHFESGYEQLLRNIYQLPRLTKPKLGSPPKYLMEETPMSFKTTTMARAFETQIDKHPSRINLLARDFFDEFFKDLKEFKLQLGSCNNRDFPETLYNNLVKYTPLRNDFIIFIDKLAKTGEEFDIDILIGFFERLPILLYPDVTVGSWYGSDFVNYKFIIDELFTYTIALLLKQENYKLMSELLHASYFIRDKYKTGNTPVDYSSFRHNIADFNEYYVKIHNHPFLNPQADFLISRLPDTLSKKDFTDADILCYFIAQLNGKNWFPRTYIYRDEDSDSLPILNKLLSKRHFEKVKGIFNIDTSEELTAKIVALGEKKSAQSGYSNSHSRMPGISNFIDEQKIATLR
ncbi:TIR domain-containing protein [Mucilaginibacter sp. cycad4]|uniref:SEFIR domain-containing protein n=1 Tax=Mucilaginibacter sp. cycad4 TaxID=3342096 RepID=UPI002AAC3375|nr:SEFIR domain-containing protein [Mucilaginibacter gossypii]WPV01959.1 TIR domain-containing protein [Mucilaginibacter gossypii]